MFPTSAAPVSWHFKDGKKLLALREKANKEYIENYNKSELSYGEFLSTAEEGLLSKQYEYLLRDFCKKFQPPMPKNIISCSFHYFKRFYLNNSVMDYHPKHILVTCVFLACKVEEFNVNIMQFVSNIKGDKIKASEIIISHELLLMQQLDFDMIIHHPYTAVEGGFIHMKAKCKTISDPERFRPAIDDFLESILFTDAFLLYSPSQIAMAALVYGGMKFQENVDSYIYNVLLGNQDESTIACLKANIKNIIAMVKNREIPSKEIIKSIEKKLEKCRNEANNPNSTAYKRKLEEMQEDEELENTRKYTELTQMQINEDQEILEACSTDN